MSMILIAPHADDEVIGCSKLLWQITKVVYVEEMDKQRESEAVGLCSNFDIEGRFLDGDVNLLAAVLQEPGNDYIVPSPEGHPLHSTVYWMAHRLCRQKSLWVYSVYMSDYFIYELRPETAQAKKETLDKFYPSQKRLWEYDARYYLFEGLIKL